MKILGFEFTAKKALPPVSLADVLDMSHVLELRVADLEQAVEILRRQSEATRKKVYRDTDQREPLAVVPSGAGQPTTPSGNGRIAWRTGDPV